MIQVIQNKFDKTVIRSIQYKSLVNLCSNPLIGHTKDTVPYLYGCSFHIPEAKAANVNQYNGIFIDYDSGTTIESVCDSLTQRKWKFVAYTSFSHSDLVHKFRIYLPFSEPVEIDDWIYMKQKAYHGRSLLSLIFANCDPCSFDLARGFCAPIKTDSYKFYIGEGRCISKTNLLKFDTLFSSLRKYDKSKSSETLESDISPEYKLKIENSVLSDSRFFDWNRSGSGQGTDSAMFRFASRLKSAGLSESEARQFFTRITISKLHESEWNHKIDSVYRSSSKKIEKYGSLFTDRRASTLTSFLTKDSR